MAISRRQFVQGLALAGAGSLAASPFASNALADRSRPTSTPTAPSVPTKTGVSGRVVVIGGGMGGTSVAKYLRLWGGDKLNVTLVERSPAYTSNIMSNGVLTGQTTLSALQYRHATLASRYGVTVVNAQAQGIDSGAKKVTLSTGTSLTYDRLVVAPGLTFDAVPGLSCLLYTSPSPRDRTRSRMPSSA